MGICHEFGPTIQPGCDHPMVANRSDACTCLECGVVCHGKFAGCTTVWARGPQRVHWRRPSDEGDAAAATVQGDPLPGRVADGMAAEQTEQTGLEGLASSMRRLIDEVGRLREDVDEQRAMISRLTESLWSDLPGTIAAELARSHQAELSDAQQSGVLRRLAAMVQPPQSVDIDALAQRVANGLLPAITAQLAETSPTRRPGPDQVGPAPGPPGGQFPWQDRTA